MGAVSEKEKKYNEEDGNLYYLSQHKLEKTLPKLIKKLKGKRVIMYGVGTLFQIIKKHYDISELNIVGVADKKFESSSDVEFAEGYKVYKLKDIKDSDVDCILVSVKFYIKVIEDLHERFKDTKIKVKPLVRKSLWTILKEL